MNLDDLTTFAALDSKNIYAHLDSLPEQVERAWEFGMKAEMPETSGIRQVIISAMGTSALGAELAASYLAGRCPAPVIIHRELDLPAWARGPETLLIISSYTGNTSEPLSCFKQGLANGCTYLVMVTGGRLSDEAGNDGAQVWRFPGGSPMGSSLGWSFALILAALNRAFSLTGDELALPEAISELHKQQVRLRREIPAALNPAKRMGGQLMGRWITVLGEGPLAVAARYWKIQINELGKASAAFEALPEFDHNSIYAVVQPEEHLPRSLALFLRAPSEDTSARIRSDATRRFFMLQGVSTDFVDAQGSTPLANLLTILHFGDYAAYYLAMAYGIDPDAAPIIQAFKAELETRQAKST